MSLNDELRREIEKVFMLYDIEKKGHLQHTQLKYAVVALLGFKPSTLVLSQMFPEEYAKLVVCTNVRDQGGKNAIVHVDRHRFVHVLFQKVSLRNRKPRDRIREMFKEMDLRCKGYISSLDLYKICQQVAPHVTEELAIEMFDLMDDDNDGKIGYLDFEKFIMMAYQLR